MTRTLWLSFLGVAMVMTIAFSCATGIAQPANPEDQPAAPGASLTSEDTGTFLWFSDIHFDPFYYHSSQDQVHLVDMIAELVDNSGSSPKWKDHTEWAAIFSQYKWQSSAYSARGKDTNQRLLQEVVNHATHVTMNPEPDFILITGDLLGHELGAHYAQYASNEMQTATLYHDFVTQTIKYIALSVRHGSSSSRPNQVGPPIFATLGNNDANCGDYAIHLDFTNSDFLTETANTFLTYFMPNYLSIDEQAAFNKSFKEGGYYSVRVPNAADNRRLIVINSIAFVGQYPHNTHWGNYPKTESSCSAADTRSKVDGAAQLDSLKVMVEQADHAWIATHIPPGMACYNHTPGNPSAYWSSNYLSTFRQLFLQGDTENNIAGTLAGHSHMSSFKLVRDDNGTTVSNVLQQSSVSPIFNNNPSFGVLTYDQSSLEINSYQLYYLDLSMAQTTWAIFPFGGISGDVETSSLEKLYKELANPNNTNAWNTFIYDYGSRAGGVVSLNKLTQQNLGCLNSLK